MTDDAARRITSRVWRTLVRYEMLPIWHSADVQSTRPSVHLAIAGDSIVSNRGCKSLMPSQDVLILVFLYWTLKQSFPAHAGARSWCNVRRRLEIGHFGSLEIPLPPLAEQRRIAGVLREQMAAVEKARAAAQARLEAVKALPAAFLRQVFPQPGQPLPDGWRWVKLGEVMRDRAMAVRSATWQNRRSQWYRRLADVNERHH